MNKPNPTLLVSLITLFTFTACQTTPSTTSQSTSIECRVPTVTALPEIKEAQEKGGVEIAVVPASYKAARHDKVSLVQAQPPSSSIPGVSVLVGSGGKAGQVYVEETTIPRLQVEPERLLFTVRINNKLARVFRGQGAVVQFNVAGKLVPFGDTDYKEFLNGIVPPRNETELKIYGPLLSSLPEKGTVGIFLYDVVTATDTAGNTTEKQNYEWYFSYSTQVVQESAERRTAGRYMDISEWNERMMKQQQEEVMRRVRNATAE